MTATESRPAEPNAERRWFRFRRRNLLVLALTFVGSGIGAALWSSGLPLSWTADYDKERYTEIRRAIEADPRHLLGKPFDEVAKAFGLDDVPWDDVAFQQPSGMARVYHFRGFALYVTLEALPAGVTPGREKTRALTPEELQRPSVLWLAHQDPSVQIDGIRGRKERMERYWKLINEECERINAEMDRNRRERSQ